MVYVTLLRKNGLITGLAKNDFFPEKAFTSLTKICRYVQNVCCIYFNYNAAYMQIAHKRDIAANCAHKQIHILHTCCLCAYYICARCTYAKRMQTAYKQPAYKLHAIFVCKICALCTCAMNIYAKRKQVAHMQPAYKLHAIICHALCVKSVHYAHVQ